VAQRFGWEEWQWDESLFAGSAGYYRRGRAPYAPGMADAVKHALALDGRGRLLDIGCGPGVIALRLAELFDHVVGLDPDAAMISESRQAASELNVSNASWACMRAEDLPGDLGTFRVISFAQSFHWMDRPRVARTARAMVEPDGAVIQINAFVGVQPTKKKHRGKHPPMPEAAIDELRTRYLGPDRRAGQGYRNTSPSGEDEIFQAAGFMPEVAYVVPDDRVLERTIDDVVAWVFSASSTAPHLFGDQRVAFERDLREILRDASPSGLFSNQLADNSLRVWRPTS
jgi:SAM-dependent methyltransferase